MHCRVCLIFPQLCFAPRFLLFHEEEWNLTRCGKGCMSRIRHGRLHILDLSLQTGVLSTRSFVICTTPYLDDVCARVCVLWVGGCLFSRGSIKAELKFIETQEWGRSFEMTTSSACSVCAVTVSGLLCTIKTLCSEWCNITKEQTILQLDQD